MARSTLTSLRNEDYRDRELLHVLNDQAGEDGFFETADIARALGIMHPDGANGREREFYARRCTATRLAWAVRSGWVERNEDRTKWRLTSVGRDLMDGKLTKGLQTALAKLKPADRILLMRELTTSYRQDSRPAAIMLRREWQHGARRN